MSKRNKSQNTSNLKGDSVLDNVKGMIKIFGIDTAACALVAVLVIPFKDGLKEMFADDAKHKFMEMFISNNLWAIVSLCIVSITTYIYLRIAKWVKEASINNLDTSKKYNKIFNLIYYILIYVYIINTVINILLEITNLWIIRDTSGLKAEWSLISLGLTMICIGIIYVIYNILREILTDKNKISVDSNSGILRYFAGGKTVNVIAALTIILFSSTLIMMSICNKAVYGHNTFMEYLGSRYTEWVIEGGVSK